MLLSQEKLPPLEVAYPLSMFAKGRGEKASPHSAGWNEYSLDRLKSLSPVHLGLYRWPGASVSSVPLNLCTSATVALKNKKHYGRLVTCLQINIYDIPRIDFAIDVTDIHPMRNLVKIFTSLLYTVYEK